MMEQVKIVVHVYRNKVVGIYSDKRVSFTVFDESMPEGGLKEQVFVDSLRNMGVELNESAINRHGLVFAVDDALIEEDFIYTSN